MENKERLLIYSATWNMGGKVPTSNELRLLIPQEPKYDIYIVGTEECLTSIAKSIFKSVFKKITFTKNEDWERLIMTQFDRLDYSLLYSKSSGATNLAVIVKRKIKEHFNFIYSTSVTAGIGNFVPNKGAVCIWFTYKNISFLVVNMHLAAGKKNQEKRNENFNRIMENIHFEHIDQIFKQHLNYYYTKNSKEIISLFDCCIFMGDFNYRLDKDIDYVKSLLSVKTNYTNKEKEVIEKLILFDQRKCNNTDLIQFQECPITFLPTFKFVPGTDEYWFHSDNKLPGWTDRILYKYNKDKITFTPNKYTSIMEMKISDHKPVLLDFLIEW